MTQAKLSRKKIRLRCRGLVPGLVLSDRRSRPVSDRGAL
ncbi:hypothetical protein I546_3216 [Mycobacterium kansasii 732]|nr:hypothetical protein I546_3216 [Mycobacterium kansasii 732]